MREKEGGVRACFNCHTRFDPIFHRVSAVLMSPRSKYAHPLLRGPPACIWTRVEFFVDATIWTRFVSRCMRSRAHTPVQLQLPGVVDALSISLVINKFKPLPAFSLLLRVKRYRVRWFRFTSVFRLSSSV